MKKAFTLIELMVVVVVIAILLSVSFRLLNAGSDADKRNTTIARMQRLENCLSGYFAAFGSYPPVALHARRDVYARLDQNGNQEESGEESQLKSENVIAACKAQPIAARYPFSDGNDTDRYIKTAAADAVRMVNEPNMEAWNAVASQLGSGFHALHEPGDVDGWTTKKSWQEVKIFQFGVLSFLLPRYQFMAAGIDPDDLKDCAQWTANNRLSSHPNAGYEFSDWEAQLKDKRLVARIPSQSVCARWMPNLEGIVSCNPLEENDAKFFGIDISDGDMVLKVSAKDGPSCILENMDVERHTVLNVMTVRDGWKRDFYYYSPTPFQSYRLWSAGPDGNTFPPWTPLDSLKSEVDKKRAASWMADDIMFLSH